MTTPPKPDSIRVGGIMRCCIETIRGLYPPDGSFRATEDQQLKCRFYPDNPNHVAIFRDGAWEWDRAAAGLPELPGTAAAGLPELPDTTDA